MIDYYLHKKCPLIAPKPQQKEDIRCLGCIWLDRERRKCIFSVDYPISISLAEMERRILMVNEKEQGGLTERWRGFKRI